MCNDYAHWKGRWEAVDEIPFAQRPWPKRQWVAANLSSDILMAIKKAGRSCKAYPPADYLLPNDNISNTDLTVVCRPIAKNFLDFAPELIAEILPKIVW